MTLSNLSEAISIMRDPTLRRVESCRADISNKSRLWRIASLQPQGDSNSYMRKEFEEGRLLYDRIKRNKSNSTALKNAKGISPITPRGVRNIPGI